MQVFYDSFVYDNDNLSVAIIKVSITPETNVHLVDSYFVYCIIIQFVVYLR